MLSHPPTPLVPTPVPLNHCTDYLMVAPYPVCTGTSPTKIQLHDSPVYGVPPSLGITAALPSGWEAHSSYLTQVVQAHSSWLMPKITSLEASLTTTPYRAGVPATNSCNPVTFPLAIAITFSCPSCFYARQ